MIFRLALVLVPLICFSCNYQAKSTYSDHGPITVSVPIIKDDDRGVLRDQLAREIASSGRFVYRSTGGEYILKVKVIKDKSVNIGYRWDRDPISGDILYTVNKRTGKRSGNFYPTTGRHDLVCKVSLVNAATGEDLVTPFEVKDVVEYDFVNPTVLKNIEFTDKQGNEVSTLDFSLGQLDSQEGAIIESQVPLYEMIAEKIGDALTRAHLQFASPPSVKASVSEPKAPPSPPEKKEAVKPKEEHTPPVEEKKPKTNPSSDTLSL